MRNEKQERTAIVNSKIYEINQSLKEKRRISKTHSLIYVQIIGEILQLRCRLTPFLSRQTFGPKFCVVWPRKMPASG